MESAFDTLSLPFVEQLYTDFLRDPGSVPPDWREYFGSLGHDSDFSRRPALGPPATTRLSGRSQSGVGVLPLPGGGVGVVDGRDDVRRRMQQGGGQWGLRGQDQLEGQLRRAGNQQRTQRLFPGAGPRSGAGDIHCHGAMPRHWRQRLRHPAKHLL